MKKVYKRDCFAFEVVTKPYCGILKKMDCRGCKFYKTQWQLNEELMKCAERNEVIKNERQAGSKAEKTA